MTTVRRLESNDCVQVLGINASSRPGVFPLDLRELSRLMALSSLHLAALSPDGSIAGYALAFSREDAYDGEEFLAFRSVHASPFVYVDQIAIAGPSRGTGIGRLLYDALACAAVDRGVTMLCCEVNTSPPNTASLAFHRQLGFKQVGELDTLDGRSVALLMRGAGT